jgi:formylglycine-generating enzyme required for sulfatase activity
VAPAADCEDGWCRIPASSFVTGSLPGGGDAFAVPSHPVVLTRAFEIMQTEVTLRQWLAVLSPTLFPWPAKLCGPECAINQVTLFDALAYANAVSAAAGLPPCYELAACEGEAGAGLRCATATFAGPDCPGYRLPSEAEWELAAGASRLACFPNGENPQGLGRCGPGPLDEVAYYCGNSAATYDGCFDCSLKGGPACCGPQPVGALAPNAFGLHDTSGNVRELTGSHYREPDAIGARVEVDPGLDATFVGAEAPTRVAIRGGSFRSADVFACSSSRAWSLASVPRAADGLRLVRTLPPSRRRPPS